MEAVGLEFEEIYEAVVGDHARRPRNFGVLPTATVRAEGDNPLCGDVVAVELELAGERIRAVRFTGRGCGICLASASMMTVRVEGRTRAEAGEVFGRVQGMLTGESEDGEEALRDLAVLRVVRRFPQRVKCAMLGWQVLREALSAGDSRGD